MENTDYQGIYENLRKRLGQLEDRRAEVEAELGDLTSEINRLNETLSHLAPLAGYVFDTDSVAGLGITEAVRGVLDRTERMSVADVIAKMEERGFDFSQYSAPTASVRKILSRLVTAERAKVEKDGWRTFYLFLVTKDDMPF